MENTSKALLERFDSTLRQLVPQPGQALHGTVLAAMAHGMYPAGKSLRALLLLESCAAAGGNPEHALMLAAALEIVHSYSLVHDDLACMDDGETRRGKPAVHKQFGEAMGVLAGDGLLTYAFEVAARALLPPDVLVRCMTELAKAAGMHGMVGGQCIDIETTQNGNTLHVQQVLDMYARKTGALFAAALRMGLIAACGEQREDTVDLAGECGVALGIAFQIQDDLLDLLGDEQLLGKPVGSDAKHGKVTVTALLDLPECRRMLLQSRDRARTLCASLPNSAALCALVDKALPGVP